MFEQLWGIMYRWFWMFLQFSKTMVDIVSSPLREVVYRGMNITEGSLLDLVASTLFSITGDMSLAEIMFGVGIPFYIAFVVVKFFVDLVA